MASIPIERCVDLDTAQQNLKLALSDAGIVWRLESTGHVARATKCTLLNASGDELDYGYGKGDESSSVTGALFEAAEHWFGRHTNSNGELVFAKAANQSDWLNGLPFSLFADQRDALTACRRYDELTGGADLFIPIALSDPQFADAATANSAVCAPDNFEYLAVARYCSNNGVAIGTSAEEARIHGLLEAIERDALSNFLVDAFILRDCSAIREVLHTSLPRSLRDYHAALEAELGATIELFALRNTFGLPVLCASLTDSAFPIEISGFGCSLSRDHAVRRSLAELAQCYYAESHFHPETFALKNERILTAFRDYPAHQRCAAFKVAAWKRRIGCAPISYEDLPNSVAPTELELYLDEVVARLRNAGRRAFSTTIGTLSGGQVVAHSLFEGQDPFFAVMEGCFVASNRFLTPVTAGQRLSPSAPPQKSHRG